MAKHSTIQTMKFKRLVRDLSECEAHVLGHLEMMWNHCHVNGNPVFESLDDVELAAGWDGEPGTLADALIKSRWLDLRKDGKYECHDYLDHAPYYVVDRMRKRESRGNVQDKSRKCPGQVQDKSGKCQGMSSPPTDTNTSTYTDPESLPRSIYADTPDPDPDARARGADPPAKLEVTGEALRRFTRPGPDQDLVERIVTVTGEPEWRDWWTAVLERLDGAGVAGELEGHVRYAEDCANPAQREIKDLGELQNPGGFLAKKATALCKRARVRWPAFPKEVRA